MRTRFLTGLAMVAALIAIFYFRGVVFFLAAAALVAFPQAELTYAFKQKEIKLHSYIGVAGGLLSVAVQYFFGTQAGFSALALCVALCVALTILRRDVTFQNILYSLFALIYPTVPMLCAGAWGYSDGFSGMIWLICAVSAAIGGDTTAFLVGSSIGRHKLCPNLSPKKSVEGAVAALFGGIAFSLCANYIVGRLTGSLQVQHYAAAAIGLIGSAAGIAGDLFASLIKRYCGIKDFSSFLPGHGGLLDRIDGIIFSIAVTFMVYTLVFAL